MFTESIDLIIYEFTRSFELMIYSLKSQRNISFSQQLFALLTRCLHEINIALFNDHAQFHRDRLDLHSVLRNFVVEALTNQCESANCLLYIHVDVSLFFIEVVVISLMRETRKINSTLFFFLILLI